MSDDKRSDNARDDAAAKSLTVNQRDTARRLGMSEREYAVITEKLKASGKISQSNIT